MPKETLAQIFSCEFCETSKNIFFIEQLWWLLLKIKMITLHNSHPTYICHFIFKQVKQVSKTDQKAKREEEKKLNNNEMDMK